MQQQISDIDISEQTVTTPLSNRSVREILCRAFVTSLLLTGSSGNAEAAVMRAIEAWKPEETSEDALLSATLQFSVDPHTDDSEADSRDSAASRLPRELRGILRLSTLSRHSLVLRVLAGLPRQVCAELLNLDASLMDHYTHIGLYQLPEAVS